MRRRQEHNTATLAEAWLVHRFTRFRAHYHLVWVSMLKANARVRPRRYYCPVICFANRLPVGASIKSFRVHLLGYGNVKLVVVRGGATVQYLVTNALRLRSGLSPVEALCCPPQEVLRRKRSRWNPEENPDEAPG
jgi:hypothetical protein